jgi:DNA repair exonuclease SbcCD nuclease subunit
MHFGFGAGTERENDWWEAGNEALQKASKADLILLVGDIFDSKIPKPETWAKANKLFDFLHHLKRNHCFIQSISGKDCKQKKLDCVPVIAIHGTHERRGRNLINPVEALEWGGFLIHLHRSTVVLRIRDELVAVHGLGGVPERYALDSLHKWDPKPVPGAFNILLIHQSIHPYIYNPIEPPSLSLQDLPKGFNLYVNGHIHWPVKKNVHGKPFLIPGSTIPTAVNRKESEIEKGFYLVDTNGSIKFMKLSSVRKVFYHRIDVSDLEAREIERKIKEIFEQIPDLERKPLVGITLTGKVKDELDLGPIEQKYLDRAIISINKRIECAKLEASVQLLREEEKKSIDELGMSILRKLADVKIRYDDIFDLLVRGEVDLAMSILMQENEEKIEKKSEKGAIKGKSGVLGKWLE